VGRNSDKKQGKRKENKKGAEVKERRRIRRGGK
jgi:hypothetical protein